MLCWCFGSGLQMDVSGTDKVIIGASFLLQIIACTAGSAGQVVDLSSTTPIHSPMCLCKLK